MDTEGRVPWLGSVHCCDDGPCLHIAHPNMAYQGVAQELAGKFPQNLHQWVKQLPAGPFEA